jgi:DNA-binding winged helix-turn-helix (wHTH) protein
MEARLAGLRARAVTLLDGPVVEEDGKFTYAGEWLYLSPVHRRIAATLSERFETPIPYPILIERGWPDTGVSESAFRASILRLRLLLRPLGLEVRAMRNRGWILYRIGSTRTQDQRSP